MPETSGPKQRIFETATRLFYTQGYNNTGINQILEEANVAKASLYKHFGSKDKLGVAYLKHSREEWFKGLDKWTASKSSGTLKLLACYDFLDYALKMNDYKGCRFINILSEIEETSPLMRQQVLEHKTALREYLKGLVRLSLGKEKEDKILMVADTAYLLFEGAIVESKIYKETWPVKTAKRIVKTLLEE